MRIGHVQWITVAQFGFAVLCLAGGWLIMQMPLPDLKNRAISTWQPTKLTAASVTRQVANTAQLTEALQRPLFRAGRRPFDPNKQVPAPEIEAPQAPVIPQIIPEPTPEPQPAPLAPQFTLKGLALHNGKKQALISTPELPDGTWVALGELIAGWKLASLDSNTVLLKNNVQELTLSLYVDNESKQVGSAAISP
jgi:hypothetical protein